MLIAEGMPLLYLELAVGQRMRQGSIGAWKIISPYLCGVGMFSVSILYSSIQGTWVILHWRALSFREEAGGSSGFTGSHQAEQNTSWHAFILSFAGHWGQTPACNVGSGLRGRLAKSWCQGQC